MNIKKILALVLALVLVCSLAACTTSGKDKNMENKDADKPADNAADMSGEDMSMTDEPKTAAEALEMHKKLLEQENEILSQNTELWEKVFMSADKGMVMVEDGKNYGDFLLDTIESAKDKFTEDELALLKKGAKEISDIENKLTALEEKFPEILDDMQNGVKSDELFGANAVTVVNFWFTTCSPCVGELSDLDALNKELAEKGGALIGVNTFTLEGDEAAIAEAKEILDKKGATYQNVYFGSDSEAGMFTANVFAYPTTYVVDRYGNIVGDPIVGAITGDAQKEALQKQIDQALANDMG